MVEAYALCLCTAGTAGGEFVAFEAFVHFFAGLAVEVHFDFAPDAANRDTEDALTSLNQVDNLARGGAPPQGVKEVRMNLKRSFASVGSILSRALYQLK